MKLETLQDLYVEELKDLYDAEQQMLKALPKMVKKASSAELKSAFEDHLQETEGHVDRLEEIFDRLGARPKGKKCKAMDGLIEEAKDLMGQESAPDVRDAALIAIAQKMEHYEIAGYGCVRTYAEQLEREEEEELLQQTLEEEKETDERLSEIAVESINVEAAEGDLVVEEEEEEEEAVGAAAEEGKVEEEAAEEDEEEEERF